MGALTGIVKLGTYTGSPAVAVDTLLGLLPNPDSTSSSGAIAGGGLLDEISPPAVAQLRTELTAMKTAFLSGFTQVAYGQYVATAADATATLLNIVTGLTDLDLAQCAVTVFRAGAEITTAKTLSEPTAGTLRIANGTYVIAAGDVVNWLARKS